MVIIATMSIALRLSMPPSHDEDRIITYQSLAEKLAKIESKIERKLEAVDQALDQLDQRVDLLSEKGARIEGTLGASKPALEASIQDLRASLRDFRAMAMATIEETRNEIRREAVINSHRSADLIRTTTEVNRKYAEIAQQFEEFAETYQQIKGVLRMLRQMAHVVNLCGKHKGVVLGCVGLLLSLLGVGFDPVRDRIWAMLDYLLSQ